MASIDLTIRNKKKEAKRYEAYLKKLGKKKGESRLALLLKHQYKTEERKNELVEAVQTEKKQNKTDQQNNIQNPEKSDSGIKNTEVVTTVKKTGQKTGIIIGGLSFLGAAMWLLYRKFHRKK